MSFRLRIFLLLAMVGLAPLAALGALDARRTRAVLDERAAREALELAHSLRSRILEYLDMELDWVRHWADEIARDPPAKEGGDYLSRIAGSQEVAEFLSLSVITPDGQVSSSTEPELVGTTPAGTAELIRSLEAGARAAVGAPQRDPVTGELALQMLVPVPPWAGSPAAGSYLLGVLQWEFVVGKIEAQKLSAAPQNEAHHIMLTNHDGLVTACFDRKEMFNVSLIELGMESARRASRGEEGTLLEPKTEHDRAALVTYTSFEAYRGLPKLDWLLFVYQDPTEVFAPVAQLLAGVRFVGLVLGAVIVAFALLIAKRLSGPINELSAAAREAGRGARILVHEGSDELGRLGTAFNEMSRNLEASRKQQDEIARTYRELVESSPGLIWTLDEQGSFTFANASCERAFGVPLDGLIGHRPLDWLTQADEPLRAQLAKPSAPLKNVDARFRTRAGGELRLVMSLTPLTAPGGRIQGAQCSAFDDTERALAHGQLEKQQAQVRQLQKMEAVGRLAGGVAHDFNNLLTVVRGLAQMVVRALEPDHAARRNLDEILRALDRGASLTQRLLAFSRRQTLKPQVLNLNTAVKEAAAMLRSLIPANIQLVTELAPDLGMTRVDPSQLDMVIVNLAINARDAMPSGGVLTVKTAPFDNVHADPSSVPELPEGRYVQLSLTDTGTGMPPEVRARLFEPFFTTKELGKGTGLGLSTAYGIVHQSGGAISVETQVGKGSTFRVTLPHVKQLEVAAEAPRTEENLRRGSEVVLLVEDEDGIREVVCEILRELGYTVLKANGPTQALELAQAASEPIALLLTDVVMPGLDGPQLAARLAPSHPQMRVLFMSGYGGEALVRSHTHPRDVVHKPFSLETITERIREVLDRPAGAA